MPVAVLALAAVAAAAPPPATSVDAAVGVVRAYYAAVSRHDYRAAFALWHGHQSYARFRRGYAQTRYATVTPIPPFESEGAAGSLYVGVKVRVDALLRSGRHQHFTGSYTLRRVNDVPGSTVAQRRWHIVDAHLAPVPAA
jgi:hypothetical protein